jgi:hypothetical protein
MAMLDRPGLDDVSAKTRAVASRLRERLTAGDIETANTLVAAITGSIETMRIEVVENSRTAAAAPVWRIDGAGRSRIRFHPRTWERHPELIFERWIAILPMLLAALPHARPGWCSINLGDTGHRPGPAFCEHRPEYPLVPDAVFLMTDGYAHLRRLFAQNRPWAKRRPVAFWRGALTGAASADGGAETMPRVQLCRIGETLGDRADFGLTDLLEASEEERAGLQALIREYVPLSDFDHYQLHIDIDGHSNSWPGLMSKLLSGGTVLKIGSPQGYRQWYYERLIPWVHYVPVRSDLADLAERIDEMLGQPRRAQAIGEQGQVLARSLRLAREIARAVPVIAAAIRD